MRLLACTLLITSLAAFAQSPVTPAAHADAVKLVEVSGAREKLAAATPGILDDATKKFAEQCKTCDPAFADEWKKRFAARLKPEIFLDIYVEEYESSFSDPELKEMIDLLTKQAAGTAVEPSPELKAKLTSTMPTFLSKVIGRCTEVGAKLGGEIAQQIGTEHPGWTNTAPKS